MCPSLHHPFVHADAAIQLTESAQLILDETAAYSCLSDKSVAYWSHLGVLVPLLCLETVEEAVRMEILGQREIPPAPV
jgi:hypothetical protein